MMRALFARTTLPVRDFHQNGDMLQKQRKQYLSPSMVYFYKNLQQQQQGACWFGKDRSPNTVRTTTRLYCSNSQSPQYNRYLKTRHEKIPFEKKAAADHLTTTLVPFDICQSQSRSPIAIKPSLFPNNKEEGEEPDCFKRGEKLVLREGMVLLKNYISHSDQIKIMKKCQELGLGPGGFYQPSNRDGSKLRLQMLCLGKDWDSVMRSYGDRRSIDGAFPPSIPVEFKHLVEEAIRDSHALIKKGLKYMNVEDVLPGMSPDICIVNFYTETGKLGLHQDRDESRKSLSSGLPVVSFSIGDSAQFLYGDTRDTKMANKVVLESGDVLIFGGDSRLIYHGVSYIKRNSAPSFLVEEANLRPGRLNLTFRKL